MAQHKILVDSNSYFRLANSIHPLLFQPFGDDQHCLYVLPELDDEYEREPRLQRKFPWVNDPLYRDNRRAGLQLSRQEKRNRTTVEEFLWDHVQTTLPGPSRIDVRILSYGYVQELPVVTDDMDMKALAEVFGIRTMLTLELLKLMLDCEHIELSKVREIVSYWSYIGDRPANFAKDYKRLFGKAAPP